MKIDEFSMDSIMGLPCYDKGYLFKTENAAFEDLNFEECQCRETQDINSRETNQVENDQLQRPIKFGLDGERKT
jgi:hypothetical protein